MTRKSTDIISGTTDVTFYEAALCLRGQSEFFRALSDRGRARGIKPRSMRPDSAKGFGFLKFIGRGIKAAFSQARGDYGPSETVFKEAAVMLDGLVANYKTAIGDAPTEAAMPNSLKTERMAQVAKAMGADTISAMIEKQLTPKGPTP